MDINPSSERKNRSQVAEILRNFEETNREEIEAIIQALTRITSRTPEQIKPYLETMLERLVESKERPFYETATPEERACAFREWADSHDLNTPLLSDYAVSRESMYDDERW